MAKQDEYRAAERARATPGVWVTLYHERANANDVTRINAGESLILPSDEFEARSGMTSSTHASRRDGSVVYPGRRWTIEVRTRPVDNRDARLRAALTAELRAEFEDMLPGLVTRVMKRMDY